MATITPAAVTLLHEVIEGGHVIAFVELTFAEPVKLIGLPAATLNDGLGNNHRCLSASPHVSAPGVDDDYVHLRFGAVPAFADYSVVELADDPAIADLLGDKLAAGTYPVVR